VGRTDGKNTLGRPRGRRKNNIKMDFQEVGRSISWIDLDHDSDRWGGSCKHGKEPSGSIKCEEFLE
jgi:hypothetical protein